MKKIKASAVFQTIIFSQKPKIGYIRRHMMLEFELENMECLKADML